MQSTGQTQSILTPIVNNFSKGFNATDEPIVIGSLKKDSSPLIVNYVSQETGFQRRRDGYKELISDPLLEDILYTQSGFDDSIWCLKANSVVRVAGDGTIRSTNLPNGANLPAGTKFKVIDRFPSTTNNIFIYGKKPNGSYFNYSSTFTNTTFPQFTNNTTLTSNQVSGVLNIVDHGFLSGSLFVNVFDSPNNRFVLLYGTQDSTSLNSFYLYPNNIRATALIASNDTIFSSTLKDIYALTFQGTGLTNPIFSKYIHSYGINNAWSYIDAGSACYAAGIQSFFVFSMLKGNQVINTLQEGSVYSVLDKNIASLYQQVSTDSASFKQDENAIYFVCKIKCRALLKALYIYYFKNQIVTDEFEVFYQNFSTKNHFVLSYSIATDSWNLLFYFDEVICFTDYSIEDTIADIRADSSILINGKIYFLNRVYDKDVDTAFPLIVSYSAPSSKILDGYLAKSKGVFIFAGSNNEGGEALVTYASLHRSMSQLNPDQIPLQDTTTQKIKGTDIFRVECSHTINSMSSGAIVTVPSNSARLIEGLLIKVVSKTRLR